MRIRARTIQWTVFAAAIVLLCSGCAAHFAPEYNPQTASQITATYKAVNNFYEKLSAVPTADRTHKRLASKYEAVAVEMKTLVWRTKIQAHNKVSTDIATRLLTDWKNIETRNQKRGGYSDALASIDRQRLDDLLTNLASVESFKREPSQK
jgi:hypothetical protein